MEAIAIDSKETQSLSLRQKERKKDMTKGTAQLVRVRKYEGYGKQKVELSELSCR